MSYKNYTSKNHSVWGWVYSFVTPSQILTLIVFGRDEYKIAWLIKLLEYKTAWLVNANKNVCWYDIFNITLAIILKLPYLLKILLVM